MKTILIISIAALLVACKDKSATEWDAAVTKAAEEAGHQRAAAMHYKELPSAQMEYLAALLKVDRIIAAAEADGVAIETLELAAALGSHEGTKKFEAEHPEK